MGIGDYFSPTAIKTDFDRISDKADKFAKGGFDGKELNELVGDYQTFSAKVATEKQNLGGGIWVGGAQELSKRLAKHPGLESYLKAAPNAEALKESWTKANPDDTFNADSARQDDFKAWGKK